jgi:hypothetical protein
LSRRKGWRERGVVDALAKQEENSSAAATPFVSLTYGLYR